MKVNLSKTQQEIVNHIDGAILVKAGPGSGKTRVVIERIKKLLTTKKRCRILALTFSNMAAEEMKSRLQDDKELEEYIDNVTIGTIHSFCLEIVQSRGNLIGLGENIVIFENALDRQTALRDVFQQDIELNAYLNSMYKPDDFLSKCLDIISQQKKRFISPEICDLDNPIPQIYKAYNSYISEQNALDFDDILFYAYQILVGNPSVVNLYNTLYHYICIDEAQDLNFAQYEIIKALCGKNYKNIMMVGDENQSIYAFNGSDSNYMAINFVEDFSPTVYHLNENFRSAKAIVEYANRLKKSDNIASNYYYSGQIKSFSFHDEEQEATFIINEIQSLRDYGHDDIEGDLKYDDFAIIARNKYVFREIEKKLMEKGIPYYYKKAVSGIDCESDIMKVFDLSMRLIINYKDVVHYRDLRKVVNCQVDGSENFDSGYELLEYVLNNSQYHEILPAISALNSENLELSKALDIVRNYITNKDISEEEKYMIINDIEQWEKHWRKYKRIVPREQRTLVSFRNHISLGKTQDNSSNNGIALLTAHMSKGLQYEVVFIMGLTEGTFPDYRAIKEGGKEMDQEINNMYVAITRTKRLCYLAYPLFKVMPWGDIKPQRKSRFILD